MKIFDFNLKVFNLILSFSAKMTGLSKEEVIKLTQKFATYMKQDAIPFQCTNEKGNTIHYFLKRDLSTDEKPELERLLKRLFPSDKNDTGLGRCNCCTRRGLLQALLIDSTGKPLLLKNYEQKPGTVCPYNDLYAYLMELHQKKDNTYTIYTVSDATTPTKEEGKEPHFYYIPSHTTEKSTDEKFNLLFNKYINQSGMMYERMGKYMSETMKIDVPFLLSLMDKLDPVARTVFKNPLTWLKGCQDKLNGRIWEELSCEEKIHICLYAMMTGSSESNVHYGFQTSNQLLDFSKNGRSEEAVIRWMNTTANPETRQVSGIAQKLEKQSVKSNVWIGLTWPTTHVASNETPYVCDFDLYVITPKGEIIYYGNKNPKCGCAYLNFDANAGCSNIEENPSECCSIKKSGTYKVIVKMWGVSPKSPGVSHGKQTMPPGVVLHYPFEIIIHNHEHEQIIPGVWNSSLTGFNVDMPIGTYDINIENPSNVTMSEPEARKYLHKLPAFITDIGENLTSTIVDLSIVSKENSLYRFTTPDSHHASVSGPPLASPVSMLTQLASASILASVSSKKLTSGSLAVRCSTQPKTTSEMIKYLNSIPDAKIEVNLRDFTPSYVTQIGGIKDGALRQGKDKIINTYCDGDGIPREPVSRQDAQVSRFDEEWSVSVVESSYTMTTTVRAIINLNGFTFFVLAGMTLPSITSEKWPLIGGFYPTMLSVDNHKHKSAFTSMNTLVKPIVNSENPLIGFIPPTNYKLKLNGREFNLQHD